MKQMSKIKTQTLPAICIIVCGFVSQLSLAGLDEGAEHLALEKMSYGEASQRIKYLYSRYIDEPDSDKKPLLYEDAIYHFSKNPNVKKHFEDFFANTPHTMEFGKQRRKAFSDLREVKAEWAVRLMIEEAKIDRKGQDFNNAPNPPLSAEEIDSLLLNNSLENVLRNDQWAAMYLSRLQLKGMKELDRFGYPKPGYLERIRQWIEVNENQLTKLLVEKFGDKTILNMDILGNAKKNSTERKVRSPDRMDMVSARELRNTKAHEDEASSETFNQKWIKWGGMGFVLLALCYYLWSKAVKRLRGSR